MMYAQAALVPAKPATQPSLATSAVQATMSFPASVKPTTPAEQYWAARALTAETLLSARLAHQGELLALSAAEEEKRGVRASFFVPCRGARAKRRVDGRCASAR